MFSRDGIDAIGEKDDVDSSDRVDPQRRSGESRVTEGRRRHLRAARRCGQHRVPSKRARTGNARARDERSHGRSRGNRAGPAGERAEDHARKISDRRCRAKQAGVARGAPESPAVLVVHLADQPPSAPRDRALSVRLRNVDSAGGLKSSGCGVTSTSSSPAWLANDRPPAPSMTKPRRMNPRSL